MHDSIVLGALSVQKESIRNAFDPYTEDLLTSCWYPDKTEEVRETLPEDARFLYPSPPRTAWQRKLENISSTNKFWTWCGQPPLNEVYLCGHYLRKTIESIRAGDMRSAVKYSGVYSHVIADVLEPGHAVFDWALDIFSPASFFSSSDEMFTNKECLRGPVDISGYRPRLLGEHVKQVEMAAVTELINGSRYGAALAAPMEQGLYTGRIEEARGHSSDAQNEAARQFADYLHTVFHLAGMKKQKEDYSLDLRSHPFITAEMSCFCRFRPTVDVYMDPSSLEEEKYITKTKPLTLVSGNGDAAEQVKGICFMPGTLEGEATADYLLIPGAYKRFSARVGFHPDAGRSLPFLKAVFSVRGDGKDLARSEPVQTGKPPTTLDVDLGRTRFLTLSMKYHGDLSRQEQDVLAKTTSTGHGVWADPVLSST